MANPASSPDPRGHWLLPMLRIIRRSDREIIALLADTADLARRDILRHGPSARIGKIVRKGQLAHAERSLRRTLASMWSELGDHVRGSRLEAMAAAIDAGQKWERPLFRAARLTKAEQEQMARGLRATSDRAVSNMLRRFSTDQIPLSVQVYKTRRLASGYVENIVNTAIGRGLTARELANEVRDSIRPDVRGGVAFAAMRLARTEINNSYHAASIVDVQEKSWIHSMRWRLSTSHPALDICDDYAKSDDHGLGAGVFPKGIVPKKPHPQCLCYVTPELPDEDDFIADLAQGLFAA